VPNLDLPFYAVILLVYFVAPVPALVGAVLFGTAGYRLGKRRRIAVAIVAAIVGSLFTPFAFMVLAEQVADGPGGASNVTGLVFVAFLLCAVLGAYFVVRWLKRPPRA